MMKKRYVLLVCFILIATMLIGCGNSGTPSQNEIQEIEITIPSVRNTEIVTSIALPGSLPENGYPLVIFMHGTSGSRHENGKFDDVAKQLALGGVASIRIDFPSCNDSKEEAGTDTITNRLNDVRTAFNYMKETYKIDASKIGVLGFSYGGKIATMFCGEEDIHTMVLWSPSSKNVLPTDEVPFSGLTYAEMAEKAKETGIYEYLVLEKYPASYTYEYLVERMEADSETPLTQYDGNLLVFTAGGDQTNSKEYTDYVISLATNAKVLANMHLPTTTHVFGNEEKDMNVHRVLVDTTADFFVEHLLNEDSSNYVGQFD